MIHAVAPTSRRPYRAPALEKGLDILELLAGAQAPLATPAIASALSRSRSEIFRMLSVLEARGFIARSPADEGFSLTPRLLELAMRNPPTRSLLDAALPVMEALAERVGQSCHLAVASGTDMVVIARVESPAYVGFSVRIGHRRSLLDSTSGRVLLAHLPEARWPEGLAEADHDPAELARDLARIRREGMRRARSTYVRGIIDLGAPVFDGTGSPAIAALTIPCVQQPGEPEEVGAVASRLVGAAAEITAALAAQAGSTGLLEDGR